MAGGEEQTSHWASLAQANVNGDATAFSFLERLLSEYEVYGALDAETQEQEALRGTDHTVPLGRFMLLVHAFYQHS